MADKNAVQDSSAEAKREWGIVWGKLHSNLPPIKPPAKPAVQPSDPLVAVVKKQQPKAAQVVTPVVKAPLESVVLRRPVPIRNQTTLPVHQVHNVQETETKGASVMKNMSPAMKAAVLFLILAAVLVSVNLFRNKIDIHDAESRLSVAKLESKIKTLEKVDAPAITPVPEPVLTGPVYNCGSVESLEAGFWEKKAHILPSSGQMTVTGCLWLATTEPLVFSGKGYRIEIPVDEVSSIACLPENQDCGRFLEHFFQNNKEYLGKPFRVLVLKGDSVTITKKGV